MISRRKFVIGATIIVLSFGFLAYFVSSMWEASVYYYTIDEFLAHRDEIGETGVRVSGWVRKGSVDRSPAGESLSFDLANMKGQGALPVRYRGILPDMFGEGREVIVEGRMDGGALRAHTILTPCPSKYKAESPGGGGGVGR